MKLPGIDAQVQGQPCGIIRVTTRLNGGVRLGVLQQSNTIPSFRMPPKLELDDPNPMKWVAIGSDCVAQVGVVVCHLSVVMMFICGEGCPDVMVVNFHWGVNISVICSDDVCVSVHLSVG